MTDNLKLPAQILSFLFADNTSRSARAANGNGSPHHQASSFVRIGGFYVFGAKSDSDDAPANTSNQSNRREESSDQCQVGCAFGKDWCILVSLHTPQHPMGDVYDKARDFDSPITPATRAPTADTASAKRRAWQEDQARLECRTQFCASGDLLRLFCRSDPRARPDKSHRAIWS
jgi:hypothetical protein